LAGAWPEETRRACPRHRQAADRCNRRKSNTLTLIGLRRKNKKEGFMAEDSKPFVSDPLSSTLQPQL